MFIKGTEIKITIKDEYITWYSQWTYLMKIYRFNNGRFIFDSYDGNEIYAYNIGKVNKWRFNKKHVIVEQYYKKVSLPNELFEV